MAKSDKNICKKHDFLAEEWCYKFLKMNSVKVSFCLDETRLLCQTLLIFDQNTQFLSSKNRKVNFVGRGLGAGPTECAGSAEPLRLETLALALG